MKKDIKVIKLDGPPMPSEYKPVDLTKVAEEILGHYARLISGSKSLYRREYPNHIVFFNANVFTKEDGKIWYGDIDLTEDEDKLKLLAKKLGKEVFLLQEMEGRFENENKKDNTVQQSALWSSVSGLINWGKIHFDKGIYTRKRGKLIRVD